MAVVKAKARMQVSNRRRYGQSNKRRYSQNQQAESQPEQQAEVQPEQQAEVQPEQQAEVQPEQQAEVQPEQQAEVQAEQQAEVQAEQQGEASEQQAEAQPEQQAESQPEPQPEQSPIQPGEVLIPAGTFTMGSPTTEARRESIERQYQVTLTRSFSMGKYEVTQSEFQARMGYNPSHFSSCGGSCPVEQVGWHEAAAYCNAVSRAAGLAECFTCTGSGTSVTCSVAAAYTGANYYNCRGYRLPTEAEWEYAYRAGTSTAFYNGGITSADCSPLDANANAIAWYCGNAQNKTHPVGGKLPNAWGLYDMAGNVWEWVYDWYGPYPTQAATNPVGAATGTFRVERGGSWYKSAYGVRAARRDLDTPTRRYYGLGFRVVRSSP